ncbi:MAG TPA: indole-3-glycerol phosphate synthase TrpC [Bacteroidales bacterium]|nr:indole-3-glycerol phosphate synthase TrpC [Bacteroidales bacterium]
MTILERIIADKRVEVASAKSAVPLKELEKSPLFTAERPSFRLNIGRPGPSIIAEFKRKSPSKGFINATAKPDVIVPGYQAAGAAAISVLTDRYFSGSLDDLVTAFSCSGLPLLRKDFVIDEYQVFEARASGASAILLIATAMGQDELNRISSRALSLELDVLFEIHSEADLQKCPKNISIIGVNNRNLETFAVNTDVSIQLLKQIPDSCLKVSESGLGDPGTIASLLRAGFDAFLVGETFMRSPDPGKQAHRFIRDINAIKPV